VVAAPSRHRVRLRRPAPGPAVGGGALNSLRTGTGFGLGSGSAPLIQPADCGAFDACSVRSRRPGRTRMSPSDTLATPEMVSYFTKDLEENKARNDVNKVSDVKLLQGDLAGPGARAIPTTPAWRCGSRWSTRLRAQHQPAGHRAKRRPRPPSVDLRGRAATGNSRRSADLIASKLAKGAALIPRRFFAHFHASPPASRRVTEGGINFAAAR
jgi:hypothetical protein